MIDEEMKHFEVPFKKKYFLEPEINITKPWFLDSETFDLKENKDSSKLYCKEYNDPSKLYCKEYISMNYDNFPNHLNKLTPAQRLAASMQVRDHWSLNFNVNIPGTGIDGNTKWYSSQYLHEKNKCIPCIFYVNGKCLFKNSCNACHHKNHKKNNFY